MNSYCKGVDFSYRTARRAVIRWIHAHVPEGQASKIKIVEL
jgi:hypothetical protein